jgi:AcrR family transcriptional regulator
LTAAAVSATVEAVDAREKILDVATRLFSSLGYTNTSLSHVAKEAEVSKALILWHFDSKESLFRSALQRSLEPYFINVVSDLDGLDEVGQIEKLIDLYYEFVSEHLFSVKLVLSLILRDEKHPDDLVARINELHRVYRNLLADIIDSARQKGIFRASVNPAQDATLVMAALNGVLVQGFLQEGAADMPALLAHLKASMVGRLRA